MVKGARHPGMPVQAGSQAVSLGCARVWGRDGREREVEWFVLYKEKGNWKCKDGKE